MIEDIAPNFSPASETHRKFLNCTSDYIIFGGGKLCASTLKTIL